MTRRGLNFAFFRDSHLQVSGRTRIRRDARVRGPAPSRPVELRSLCASNLRFSHGVEAGRAGSHTSEPKPSPRVLEHAPGDLQWARTPHTTHPASRPLANVGSESMTVGASRTVEALLDAIARGDRGSIRALWSAVRNELQRIGRGEAAGWDTRRDAADLSSKPGASERATSPPRVSPARSVPRSSRSSTPPRRGPR